MKYEVNEMLNITFVQLSCIIILHKYIMPVDVKSNAKRLKMR